MDWAIVGSVLGAATLIATVGFGWLNARLQRKAEARATARADVSWALVRATPGAFWVMHVGRDPAFDVLVVLSVSSELRRVEVSRVDPENHVEVTSAYADGRHRALAEAWRRYRDHPAVTADAVGITLPAPRPVPELLNLNARVTWRSASGRWDSQTIEKRESARFG